MKLIGDEVMFVAHDANSPARTERPTTLTVEPADQGDHARPSYPGTRPGPDSSPPLGGDVGLYGGVGSATRLDIQATIATALD